MTRTGAGRARAAGALAAVFVVLLACAAPVHAADFNQGVTSLNATQARVWFTPVGFTAGYVIVHYTMTGVAQQNLQMAYNSGTAQWEYTLSGLSTGSVVTYWFTYMKDMQYDSPNFQYTHSGGAATATATTRPTATATSTATTRPRATATATTRPRTTATATTARATATTARSTATATRTATQTTAPTATPTATTSGGSGCWPAWDSAATYVLGSQASRNGRNYTAAYWNIGLDPAVAGNAAPPNGGTPWFVDRFCGPTPTPLSGAINAVVSAVQFDNIFPYRNAFYTYNDFVSAVNAIPAFAGVGDTNTKGEAAAALANFAHETGGLWYVKEIQPNLYCSTNTFDFPKHANGTPVTECACVAGQQYYGRGATQISWNYNYCAASEWLYGNNNFDDGVDLTLVNNPSLVEQNGTLAWKTAIWYWMTQTGPVIGGWPLETSHDAITTTDPTGNYGFGGTIRAINGALECNGGNGAQVQSRITKFTSFLGILGYSGGQFGRNDC